MTPRNLPQPSNVQTLHERVRRRDDRNNNEEGQNTSGIEEFREDFEENLKIQETQKDELSIIREVLSENLNLFKESLETVRMDSFRGADDISEDNDTENGNNNTRILSWSSSITEALGKTNDFLENISYHVKNIADTLSQQSDRRSIERQRDAVASGEGEASGVSSGLERQEGNLQSGFEGALDTVSRIAKIVTVTMLPALGAIWLAFQALKFEPVRDSVIKIVDFWNEKFMPFMGELNEKFNAIVDKIPGLTSEGVKFAAIFTLFLAQFKTFRGIFKGISDTIVKMVSSAKNIGQSLSSARGVLSKLGGAVSKAFLPLNIILAGFHAIRGALEGFEEDGILGAIRGAIEGVFHGMVSSILDGLKNVIAWVADLFGFEGLAEWLRDFSFRDRFQEGFDQLWENIGWIADQFKALGSNIKSLFSNFFSLDFWKTQFGYLLNWIPGVNIGREEGNDDRDSALKDIGNWLKERLEKIFSLDFWKEKIGDLVNWIPGVNIGREEGNDERRVPDQLVSGARNLGQDLSSGFNAATSDLSNWWKGENDEENAAQRAWNVISSPFSPREERNNEVIRGQDERRLQREQNLQRMREQDERTGGASGRRERREEREEKRNFVTNTNVQNIQNNQTTAMMPNRSTRPSGPIFRYSTIPDAP